MGAVISEGSMNTILEYIEQGKKDGRLITGGGRATDAGEGFFLQPTVIADIQPKSKLEQEEIFGPVLVVIKVEELRSRSGDRERHRIRIDRCGLHQFAGEDRSRHSRIPRRQPVHQSQVHRRDCRGASLRRIQHVGHRLESRRPGLSISVHAGKVRRGENQVVVTLPSEPLLESVVVGYRHTETLAPETTNRILPHLHVSRAPSAKRPTTAPLAPAGGLRLRSRRRLHSEFDDEW